MLLKSIPKNESSYMADSISCETWKMAEYRPYLLLFIGASLVFADGLPLQERVRNIDSYQI